MPALGAVESRLLSSRRRAEILAIHRRAFDPSYDPTEDAELVSLEGHSDRDSDDSDDDTEEEEDGVAVLLTALRRAEAARASRDRQSFHLQRLLSTVDALIGVRRAWVAEDSARVDVALRRAKKTCVCGVRACAWGGA